MAEEQKPKHICKCGEPLEDTGRIIGRRRIGKFQLLACNSCNAQGLFKELPAGHYEI